MESISTVSIDEAGLGRRLHAIRKERKWTLKRLASKIGCDHSYLSRLETGKSFNPSLVLIGKAAAVLEINEEWLRLGIGDPFSHPYVPQDFDVEFLSALAAIAEEMSAEQIMKVLSRILHHSAFSDAGRSFWVRLFGPWLKIKLEVEPFVKRDEVDRGEIKHHLFPAMSPMPGTWEELREALRLKTQSQTAKRELARKLRVTLAAVSQWRSGATAPAADKVLPILAWVRARQAPQQQKKSAGSAATRPAPKTRKGKTKTDEKSKSDQKKQ
jgi:transcriptional regulator with XRE-family HTH domain